MVGGKDAEEDEQAFQVIFKANGVQFLADTAEGADLGGRDEAIADEAGGEQLIGGEEFEHEEDFAKLVVHVDATEHALDVLGNFEAMLGDEVAFEEDAA